MITQIQPNTRGAYGLMHNGILALARAERQGIRVDMEYCEQKSEELTERITKLEDEFYNSKFYSHWKHTVQGTPNISSHTQLSNFLYGVKKYKPKKFTKSGKGATDEEALSQLNIPELNGLLEISKLKKLRDTYLGSFMREQVNGFMHPFFNLHLVRTFRSSSDSPNFQNIPKRDKEAMHITRKALYPRIGNQLMAIDFKGIEVAVAACYHQDPTMIKYVTDPASDMHGDMASQIYCVDNFNKKTPEHSVLRSAAKNGFVFPEFYGDYYKNCAISLACTWGKLPETKWSAGSGIDVYPGTPLADHLTANNLGSLPKFIDHLKEIEFDFWNNRFPVYAKWKDKWWREYQKTGYFNTLTGFRCGGVMSKNDAVNYPVQGSAFHCLLLCLILIDAEIIKQQMQSRIIGQIHDEVVLDIYPPELETISALVKRVMTVDLPRIWKWIIVPLEVEADLADVDDSFAEMKPYKLL